MAETAPEPVKMQKDGNTRMLGGVSSALSSDLLISNSQIHWAINAEMRKGKPHTRGAWIERAVLPFGNVQGVEYFSLGLGSALMGISGKIYRLTLKGANVNIDRIPLPGIRSPQAPQMWMVQTTQFMVIQDRISRPLIYNGIQARSAKKREVPLGGPMAYGNSRLWVGTLDGEIIPGDVAGTGIGPGSELNFTGDGVLLQQGQAFRAPGDIRVMKFMPSNDAARANGPLIVGGTRYTLAIRADIADREQWPRVEGFQRTIFPELGMSGQTSVVTSNLDMLYRDGSGGLRTFRQAVADYETAGTTSLSEDISRITDHESVRHLETCPAVVTKDRLIMGASPFKVYKGCLAFRHMISMDFAPLSTRGAKGQPIFDGQWEGIYCTHLFKIADQGEDRTFAVSKEADGDNRLWEYVPSKRVDESFDSAKVSRKRPITWQLFYPDLTFEGDLQKKLFRRVDLWVTKIQGNVSIKIYFTQDGRCDWKFLHEHKLCANLITADNQDKHAWRNYCPGHQPQLVNYEPEPEDVEGEDWVGYRFAFRLVIEGECEIDKLLAWALPLNTVVYADGECREGGDESQACQFIEAVQVQEEYRIETFGDSPKTYVNHDNEVYVNHDNEDYVNG